ncbi:NAD(P)-binding protein [Annulohypoxylon maeteangense]|uniref:NAD(P)-binding protein n=1 Tax=Annulohypoxylon maeteangense TaxID=1927788 RepID=UPI002008069C|nr:NAD(P)-binding protein [Annulohypoxylon maeteangense]KAI0887647.1 NAD(P)-binding protein [Annulohypoxylon maeteangense]
MSSSNTNTKKTIAFLGASGGVGLAALTRAMAAGHTCIALCRTPSKLTDRFPEAQYPNLKVVQGNAHDVVAVARCLFSPSPSTSNSPVAKPVDMVMSSIGGQFQFAKMTIDDPHVCENGMKTLLSAIDKVRRDHAAALGEKQWRPRIIVVSTCGISKAGRDFPLATLPIYKFMLKVPHVDKLAMESLLTGAAAEKDYSYSIVRPSLLTDPAVPDRKIRVGVDEKPEVGYGISRDDTGRWIFENLLGIEGAYENRVVTITW